MKKEKKKTCKRSNVVRSSFALDLDSLASAEASSSLLFAFLRHAVQSTILSEQQRSLSQLLATLKSADAAVLDAEPVGPLVDALVSGLFLSDVAIQLKRQLMQILLAFPPSTHEGIVARLGEKLVAEDYNDDDTLRVEATNLLLQNDFSLGIRAAMSRSNSIGRSLASSLHRLSTGLAEKTLGLDNDVIKRILFRVKTLTLLLMKEGCCVEETTKASISNELSAVLSSEALPLDCHTSAAICLVHLNKLNLVEGFSSAFVNESLLSVEPSNKVFMHHALFSSWPALTPSTVVDHVELLERVLIDLLASKEVDLKAGEILIFAKCFSQWTKKMLEAQKLDENRVSFFLWPSTLMTSMLDFVWTFWEFPMDCLRHQLEEIFSNVVLFEKNGSTTSSSSFQTRLLPVILQGNYLPLLNSFVKANGAGVILRSQTDFPRKMLDKMSDSSYACQITKLFIHCLQASPRSEHFVWIRAIAEQFKNSSPTSPWILTTMIPKISRFFPYVVQKLTEILVAFPDFTSNHSILGALMKCLRLAKSYNLELPVSSEDVLSTCLSSSDDQICLEAFAFLAEVKRPSLPIPSSHLDLVFSFLSSHPNSQSPFFRQNLFSLHSDFLTNLCISASHLQKEDPVEHKDCLQCYKDYLKKVLDLSVEGLCFSANYPRRTTAINHYKHLVDDVFSDEIGRRVFALSEFFDAETHVLPIVKCLCDSYEDNMELAMEILTKIDALWREESRRETWLPREAREELWSVGHEKLVSTKPQESLSASYLIRLLSVVDTKPRFSVLRDLLKRLESQVEMAESNLLEAAERGPMYGTFLCLRLLLWNGRDSIEFDGESIQIIDRLLTICFRAAAVVGPIVSSSSPEGFMPDVERNGSSTVTSQMLLLCSWRTMKEVSLHLGFVAERLSGAKDNGALLLRPEIFGQIGEDFLRQMLESKHRGAFEVGYEGFIKVAKVLWSSDSRLNSDLPAKWLEDLLRAAEHADVVTNTRRSAGLPYCVVALLSASDPRTKKGLYIFEETLKTLMRRAEKLESVSVHAMNVLRMIVKDARFGDAVLSSVADCFVASIRGFAASNWMVRNSSTLLFSALMQRTFGVYARSHDDEDDDALPPKKNCMNAFEFFARFRPMKDFLMEILTEAADRPLALNPRLFPALIVLARLLPSPQEELGGVSSLDRFLPLIMTSLSSPIMKTRICAAKALVPLVDSHLMDEIVAELQDERVGANKTHGLLLVIKFVAGQEQNYDLLSGKFGEIFRFVETEKFKNNLILQSSFWDAVFLSLDADRDGVDAKINFKFVNEFVKFYLDRFHSLKHIPGFTFASRSAVGLSMKFLALNPRLATTELIDLCLKQNRSAEIRFVCAESLKDVPLEDDVDGRVFGVVFDSLEGFKGDCDSLASMIHLATTKLRRSSLHFSEIETKTMLEKTLRLCETTSFDKVLRRAVEIGGVLAERLCQLSQLTRVDDPLERYLRVLENNANPEESGALRLTVAESLTRLSKVILLDPLRFSRLKIRVWLLLHFLSQCDEAVIRSTIRFASTKDEDFLSSMVDNIDENLYWDCFETLKELLLSPLKTFVVDDDAVNGFDQDDEQFSGAEQLFDKGDANPFAEERFEMMRILDAMRRLWGKMQEAGLVKGLSDGDDEEEETFSVDFPRCLSVVDVRTTLRSLRKFKGSTTTPTSKKFPVDFFRNPKVWNEKELNSLRMEGFEKIVCF